MDNASENSTSNYRTTMSFSKQNSKLLAEIAFYGIGILKNAHRFVKIRRNPDKTANERIARSMLEQKFLAVDYSPGDVFEGSGAVIVGFDV